MCLVSRIVSGNAEFRKNIVNKADTSSSLVCANSS